MSAKPYLRPGRVLSLRERERFDRQHRDLESRMLGAHGLPTDAGFGARELGRMAQFLDPKVRENQAMLARKKARIAAILSNGTPDSLSRGQKNQLERRAQMLALELQKRMCPRSLHNARSDGDRTAFRKAVEACKQQHHPKFKAQAAEYKKIMREIDPENPRAGNLEEIRPE
jgi:rhamnose utilization protein RhaD (predicted bifunctional aldolase and dehydrogenase)